LRINQIYVYRTGFKCVKSKFGKEEEINIG
jgi:hypothetical protein